MGYLKRLLKGLLGQTVAMLFGAMVLGPLIVKALGLHEIASLSFHPYTTVWSFGLIFGLVTQFLMVGLMEEGFFRYLLMDKLLTQCFKLRPWLSLGISAVCFGMAHFANPGNWVFNLPQVVGATLSGLWLGHLYRKEDLAFVIFVHGLYDLLITLVILYLNK